MQNETSFKLNQMGFGQYTSYSNSVINSPGYVSLSFPGQTLGAQVAFDYQGLGLPTYLYDQFWELVLRSNANSD